MRKIIKIVLRVLLVAFIIIQFFRPEKNISGNTNGDISAAYTVPSDVKNILETACNDCHSNKTAYPWYANIQPAAWWLNDHVEEGKRELNFNEFSNYRLYRQYRKLEEIVKEVEEGEMPLTSYTLIHWNAKLKPEQKTTLINWAKGLQDTLKARYPADSLVNSKKRKS